MRRSANVVGRRPRRARRRRARGRRRDRRPRPQRVPVRPSADEVAAADRLADRRRCSSAARSRCAGRPGAAPRRAPRARPTAAGSRPSSISSSVVLPEPFGPMTPTIDAGRDGERALGPDRARRRARPRRRRARARVGHAPSAVREVAELARPASRRSVPNSGRHGLGHVDDGHVGAPRPSPRTWSGIAPSVWVLKISTVDRPVGERLLELVHVAGRRIGLVRRRVPVARRRRVREADRARPCRRRRPRSRRTALPRGDGLDPRDLGVVRAPSTRARRRAGSSKYVGALRRELLRARR